MKTSGNVSRSIGFASRMRCVHGRLGINAEGDGQRSIREFHYVRLSTHNGSAILFNFEWYLDSPLTSVVSGEHPSPPPQQIIPIDITYSHSQSFSFSKENPYRVLSVPSFPMSSSPSSHAPSSMAVHRNRRMSFEWWLVKFVKPTIVKKHKGGNVFVDGYEMDCQRTELVLLSVAPQSAVAIEMMMMTLTMETPVEEQLPWYLVW